MAELDPRVFQEQLEAAARRMLLFPRLKDKGYQGPIELEDVEVIVRVRCGDGVSRVVEPSEINDGHPDLFVREYVTVGHKPGMSIPAFIERFVLPFAGPKVGGLWASLRGLFGAVLILALLTRPAFASGTLTLDHDILQSMARTGSPGINLDYTPTRVLLKTRYRAAGIWWDVRLAAEFIRTDKRVRLALRELTAGGIRQNASRFDEAAAKLSKLVDVETAADRVVIVRDGEAAYKQDIR